VKPLSLKGKSLYNCYQEFKHSFRAEQFIGAVKGKQSLSRVTAKGVKGRLPTTDALSQTWKTS
jgi:hypothetical protein